MSKIKLPHASGNSMSIGAPATNPASDLELKLPATVGSANQFLKNSGTAGTLGFSTLVEDSSGNIGIGVTPSDLLHLKFGTNLHMRFNDDVDSVPTISSQQDNGDYNVFGLKVNSLRIQVGTSPTEKLRINNEGVVSINTTATGFYSVDGNLNIANTNTNNWTCLGLSRNTTNGRSQIRFNNPNGCVGSISTADSATAFNTSSDYRLKENQVAISDGITRVKQLKPYKFNFKVDSSKIVDGFFAHEVTPVVPEAISGEKDAVMEDGSIDAQSIDQSKLVPLLTAALQEAITKIELLETKVSALEAG